MSLTFWMRLLAVTLLTTSPILRAADPPVDSDGYKMVPVKSGDKTTPIRVKETNFFQNASSSSSGSSDTYDPSRADFTRTSSLANKPFSGSAALFSQSNSALKDLDQSAFVTKSYFGDPTSQTNHAMPNLDVKISPPSSSAYSRSATGFNKSFTTSSFEVSQNKSDDFASKTSPDQGRASALGARTADTFASSLGSKTYQGPEADKVRRDMTRMNEGLMQIKDLPNRPLTVDEVRALINHGVKPDTNAKPEPPSKPLNDPDYKPEPSPAPPSEENDKNDALPPPGTMAAPAPPENSEPLPSH